MARSLAKDHSDKRRAILKTAAAFFADTGYDRAAMSQLAKACGISKASIYHYYTNKETLLYDILHHHLDELLTTIQAQDISDKDPETNLGTLAGALLEVYRGADAEHRLQLEAMRYLPAESQKELADMQRQIVAIFGDSIRAVAPELFETGEADLRAVTMSMFGMLNWFYLWHQPSKGLSRAEYAKLATDILVGGLIKLKIPAHVK
ncbi:TetR family transcriptional regulator [Amylibacter marinus]|uniref:TetR family transcriptional regulator n=1 Tax=Amylibacter marinus TaxID=1475483 RepID=A0ABQ5VVM3_9RHOB|nr:TetR/AcrR family transcriptional regulator [Amylibacter marinus]GLQ35143.1 TetR family transcriptional regulator [Amylibacter marinus]